MQVQGRCVQQRGMFPDAVGLRRCMRRAGRAVLPAQRKRARCQQVQRPLLLLGGALCPTQLAMEASESMTLAC